MNFRLDPDASYVLADRIQIQQVILNLFRNAIEAMQGQPRRELIVETQSRPEGIIEVVVSDTGSGIGPDIAAQLFQPFVTTKEQGMGVGLSICRTIIESHGGKIWAESNSPEGASFRFTLRQVHRDEMDDVR